MNTLAKVRVKRKRLMADRQGPVGGCAKKAKPSPLVVRPNWCDQLLRKNSPAGAGVGSWKAGHLFSHLVHLLSAGRRRNVGSRDTPGNGLTFHSRDKPVCSRQLGPRRHEGSCKPCSQAGGLEGSEAFPLPPPCVRASARVGRMGLESPNPPV